MRWIYGLFVLPPVAIGLVLLGGPALWVFAIAAASLIPTAALIGEATEQVARRCGPRVSALLNATFGNAAEMILAIFGLRAGLIGLVKASITGSIIGNSLLVLGMAFLAGGLRKRDDPRVTFDRTAAQRESTMLLLAVVGLLVPALFAQVHGAAGVGPLLNLSMVVACVLMLSYVAGMVYAFSWHAGPPSAVRPHAGAQWSLRAAAGLLAGSAVLAAVLSDLVVRTVEPAAQALGMTELFIGVVLVPIIGNVAEHFTAVQAAARGDMDLAINITTASSTQIALFVAPLTVLLSLLLGHPMNYVFTPMELVSVGIATASLTYVCIDGEATWLEGVQLLAVYVIAATAFYFSHAA